MRFFSKGPDLVTSKPSSPFLNTSAAVVFDNERVKEVNLHPILLARGLDQHV